MRHKITYANGATQVKNLIPHSVYLTYSQKKNILILQSKDPKVQKEFEVKIKELDKAFKKEHGEEYFTNESPLGLAIKTDKLVLPEHQGGTTRCTVVNIQHKIDMLNQIIHTSNGTGTTFVNAYKKRSEYLKLL